MMNKKLLFITAALLAVVLLLWLFWYQGETGPDADHTPPAFETSSPPATVTPPPTPSPSREHPDYPDIDSLLPASSPGNGEQLPNASPTLPYPGGGDLDEEGEALPKHRLPSPTPLPLYQNESETSNP